MAPTGERRSSGLPACGNRRAKAVACRVSILNQRGGDQRDGSLGGAAGIVEDFLGYTPAGAGEASGIAKRQRGRRRDVLCGSDDGGGAAEQSHFFRVGARGFRELGHVINNQRPIEGEKFKTDLAVIGHPGGSGSKPWA